MKKFYFVVITIFLNSSLLQAQKLIAVQNGGTPTFYTMLDSAIVHAQNGDTLYLPGELYTNTQFTINICLHIVGVGVHPDSSSATLYTRILGNITFTDGSDGGSITGVYLQNGNINLIGVSNFTVNRCNIKDLSLGTDTDSSSSNNVFVENIVNGQIYGKRSKMNHFYSNIIGGSVSYLSNYNSFKNNIFLANNTQLCSCGLTDCFYAVITQISSSLFENNVFLRNVSATCAILCNLYNCTFNNNLFVDNINIQLISNTSIGYNNIMAQPQSSIFVNQTGSTFSFNQNYHLQPTCLGVNAGRDGTDIGIYGGAYPWKDGNIPFNPHYQSITVAPTTDSTGNLNVNIKVEAQNR